MSGARRGTAYIVGAGPGDAGLATMRAQELIAAADVVLDGATLDHDALCERLVEHALAGRSVVARVAGDPYLLDCGGELALRCRAASVPFEVVPGVAGVLAACADAGIPVTHRDMSRHVTIANAGHDRDGDPDFAWLASTTGTLLLAIDAARLGDVCAELVVHGMAPSRLCAVVSRGTTSDQRVIGATLATIEGLVARADLAEPMLLVVGDVVELREHLAWFERRPLFGTTIAVTRARSQSSELVGLLESLGARVAETPTIAIERLDPRPLDAAIDELANTPTVVFTSRNGVEATFARIAERGLDTRVFGAVERIAAVGDATAAALGEHGLRVDIVPDAHARSAAGVLDALLQMPLFGTRCAIFRAERGDERLPEELRRANVDANVVPVYRTVIEPATEQHVEALLASDLLALTSASTALNAIAMVDDAARLPPCVTIGHATSAAAHDAGLQVVAQATEPSMVALVAAVTAAVTRMRQE